MGRFWKYSISSGSILIQSITKQNDDCFKLIEKLVFNCRPGVFCKNATLKIFWKFTEERLK